jgi:alanine racemase
MHTIGEIQAWSNGILLQGEKEAVISELAIDSRKVNLPEETLFIALKTPRRNGHDFIQAAYSNGVRSFLVQQPVEGLEDAQVVQVPDTLTALQQIAAQHRKKYTIPVIGITGSNGKTIVKEWLYQLLNDNYRAVRSPKSYNSQIGVPLSVWLMEPEHNLAIFEAGLSQPGEMERLEKIIHPTLGIFTNIGEAHSEGFLNIRQKIHEKLVLFRHAEQLIYCRDYPQLNECIVQYRTQIRDSATGKALELFTWSRKSEDATLRIVNEERQPHHTTIDALYKGERLRIQIPFIDPASVENAIHCWCAMLLLGTAYEHIADRMKLLQPVAMRLELRHGINECTIINDTYNSDLTSLFIALEFLDQQRQHKQRTVILSDMLQVATSDSELYEEVAETISRKNIHRFIGIGPALYKHKAVFRKHRRLRSIFFKSTADFLKKFHLLSFDNEAILLKGARVFAFEEISSLLEQEVHQTVLAIDLSALRRNLNFFRGRTGNGVKTMAMVKAFSYGSGSYEIANVLQYEGVDYLSVAYTDEGVALRKAGITLPIMVMSPEATAFDRMIAWKLEPEIYNQRSLEAFLQIAHVLQVSAYPIHIKLDTGMHRLGFMPAELDRMLALIHDNPLIRVASIFSHLAASEDEREDGFTLKQAAMFREMSNRIIQELGYKPLRHLCNTAGIARHPELHFDMVRLGLGLYGIDSSGKLAGELEQISTLRTTIAQIKEIPAGETVGYGRKGGGSKALRTATISIGYADGYPRALGHGKSYVLINGQQAPVVGVVCMDMCMVDVTDLPEAQEGDEVIVFGPQLPLTQLAQWADTIPYEMMTGISQRVKRVYVNEG